MTLRWPDRKRSLLLIDSLRDALNASVETSKKSPETSESPPVLSDAGPSWICAHCHKDNPGNFEECWKCQQLRRREEKA
jgi:hypothetical protein